MSSAQPLTRMRRAIARNMSASAQVPQFTIERDARLEALAAWREDTAGADGSRTSYSDATLAAVARALRAHPQLNGSFGDDGITVHDEISIGIAFDVEGGLVAPSVRAADTLSLPELAAERVRLGEAARAGTLERDDLAFVTFTISNLGPLGVRRFRALVVPPQAAILALGAITEDRLMSMSLSCDHRVVDGAPAARFLADVTELLEQPAWLEELE